MATVPRFDDDLRMSRVRTASPTDSGSVRTRIASLYEEMDRIHLVNGSYWKRGEAATAEERAQYYRGLDRLEEIRAELLKLESV